MLMMLPRCLLSFATMQQIASLVITTFQGQGFRLAPPTPPPEDKDFRVCRTPPEVDDDKWYETHNPQEYWGASAFEPETGW